MMTIENALIHLKQGKMIILVDDESRENEGDLVIAAERVTPEAVNFMSLYGRGLICMPLSHNLFSHLKIPMMTEENRCHHNTAFGISIGAREGITTGISAADRAHTIQTVVAKDAQADDLVMPGHVFPLRARKGGVLERAGHTEGSVDLMPLAGLRPAAVICEIMNQDGSMARMPDLEIFSKQHDIPIVSIDDLITYRRQQACRVTEVSAATLPTHQYGQFTIKTFKNELNGLEHSVLISEKAPAGVPLVRIHSECLTGDVFTSSRCDCGHQLDLALQQIAQEGGILLYLRQEGRGIGLGNKIRAYALQEQGLDTVEANQRLGFAADQRDYGVAAQILKSIGFSQVRLLTNNPRKIRSLERYGITVAERVPLMTTPTGDNIRYLQTKKNKLGHLLEV